MNILIVEDDIVISEGIREFLEEHIEANYQQAYEGATACDILQSDQIDLVILDIMLPEVNGFEIISFIKLANLTCGILCLSAKNQTKDVVKALSMGADDYLKKPFELAELKYRVISLLRLKNLFIKQLAGWNYLTDHQMLEKAQIKVELTMKEHLILKYLLKNKGKYVSKEILLHYIWGEESDVDDKHLKVQISLLRKKMKDHQIQVKIINRKGIGYQLIEDNGRN